MSTRRLSAVSVLLMVMFGSVLAGTEAVKAEANRAQADKDKKAGGEMAAKPKMTHKKKHPAAMKGVPSGVGNCIDHLIKMAAADPLIAYEGHPSEIVTDGLLWNSPQSKCSVGADQGLRDKIADVALAWNLKDAAKVRSLLEEVKTAAAGLITEAPKHKKHKRASNKSMAAANKNAGTKK